MNRRSFLGLIPFAPIVGPALAKEAAEGIARVGGSHPAPLDMVFTKMRYASGGYVGERGRKSILPLRRLANGKLGLREAASMKQEPKITISITDANKPGSHPVTEDALPDDIWPL